jgi:toxin ParE1/3/4
MKPVAFSKLAKREIDAAAQWFEDRKEGLGKQFYQRVDEAAEKVERNPNGFQICYKDMRRVGLRQFTEWALYFRILTDDSLVIACISGKRHPALPHERASGVVPIKPEP